MENHRVILYEKNEFYDEAKKGKRKRKPSRFVFFSLNENLIITSSFEDLYGIQLNLSIVNRSIMILRYQFHRRNNERSVSTLLVLSVCSMILLKNVKMKEREREENFSKNQLSQCCQNKVLSTNDESMRLCLIDCSQLFNQ